MLTARPYRHHDQLVDLPGQLTQVAEAAGLMLYERNAALLVGLREDRLVPRPSFFQLDQVRKARARGLPLRIIAHEDVLVFRRPPKSASSGKLKDPQREPEGAGADCRRWTLGFAVKPRGLLREAAPGAGGRRSRSGSRSTRRGRTPRPGGAGRRRG